MALLEVVIQLILDDSGALPLPRYESPDQAKKDDFRLDCVIRGVKVKWLLRQATVIELRPNPRQHRPQQQPFDTCAPKRPEPTLAGEPR